MLVDADATVLSYACDDTDHFERFRQTQPRLKALPDRQLFCRGNEHSLAADVDDARGDDPIAVLDLDLHAKRIARRAPSFSGDVHSQPYQPDAGDLERGAIPKWCCRGLRLQPGITFSAA